MPTIGIAVPCYKPHWDQLPDLLNTIEDSSRLPDQVVVSCSSWDEDTEGTLEGYSFPVLVLYAKESRNAAQNRNRAAMRLDTDLISFIDADDRTHPRRLEIVANTLADHPSVDALYHSYIREGNFTPPSYLLEMERNPDAWTNCRVVTQDIHHGHVTIRKRVFETLKFVEDPWAYRMEDGIFARQLIEQGFTIRYIPLRLSLYNQNVK